MSMLPSSVRERQQELKRVAAVVSEKIKTSPPIFIPPSKWAS